MTINDIREKLKHTGLDTYVVDYGNKFIGQDVLINEHKLKHLTGFSGSAGILAVTADKAFLFVDGRYELQARMQTNNEQITVVDELPRLKNVCDYLMMQNLSKIGYDAWCHSAAEMEFLKRKYKTIDFIDVGDWLNIDSKTKIEVMTRDVQFAGMDKSQKCAIISEFIKEKNADYLLISSADSVSWLLNIYARDLPFSPVVRAYALINAKGEAKLFADGLQTKADAYGFSELFRVLSVNKEAKVLYDAHTLPEKFLLDAKENVKFIKTFDLCQKMKAEKNAVELQGMINCHVRDAVALVKLFAWLEKNWQDKTELDVVYKLHELRASGQYYFSESFATIAAAGENAAIVHYQPNENSNWKLTENSLLLIDSGGQYLDGTTDVTRTVVIGKPTDEMIKDFTTVLKAHIALAKVQFPELTGGIKLDVIARSEIWALGLDYKHGTGHGVACFGNVHEPPISISINASDFGLKENMVCSNEPGIYKKGRYGIRIENLQYIAKTANAGFLQFKYLTKVPIDKTLIDKYMLSAEETEWLNYYHKDVYMSLSQYLSKEEKMWLERACSPL